MPHQIEVYTLTYACGHTSQERVEHWGDASHGNQTTGSLCAKCDKIRERKDARIMLTHGKAIKAICDAAHPLREAVQTASGERVVAGATYTPASLQMAIDRGDNLPPATHDYMGRPTDGRITYADACETYGAEVVAIAMELGKVHLDDATPKSRLMANGVNIG